MRGNSAIGRWKSQFLRHWCAGATRRWPVSRRGAGGILRRSPRPALTRCSSDDALWNADGADQHQAERAEHDQRQRYRRNDARSRLRHDPDINAEAERRH